MRSSQITVGFGRSAGRLASWVRSLVLNVLLLSLYPLATGAQSVAIGPEHSALWFDANRSGEGWVVEVLESSRVVLDWYTYDDQGGQRWLQGLGEIVQGSAGDIIEIAELYVTRGGRFGPDFNPDDVEIQVVGQAQMHFDDCDRGSFSYTAFGLSRTIQIQRLSIGMGTRCDPIHGVPGEPVQDYAGQSGHWYDTGHTGEGFSLQWLSRNEAALTWYTYDSEGNQYWMVGTGSLVGNEIVFPTLNAARGARFGDEFDPDDVELIGWGSLVFELGCDEGTARYESNLPEFGTGTFELIRLTRVDRLACPWTRPKLTELYQLTWKELPIDPNPPGGENNIQAASVSNNGVVAAHRVQSGRSSLMVWQPGQARWVSDRRVMSLASFQVSPDGASVVGSDSPGDDFGSARIWTEAEGWQPLSGLVLDQSLHFGVSEDLSQVVGTGRMVDDPGQDEWIWSLDKGQQLLPVSEAIPGGTPVAVSNDGTRVFGAAVRAPPEGFSIPRRPGIAWIDGQEPQALSDSLGRDLGAPRTCSANCGFVFGQGQSDYHLDDHPNYGQGWYWKSNEDMAYLGPPPADSVTTGYGIGDVTADGSFVVGRYLTPNGTRSYIWTQDTGMVSMFELFSELEIGDLDWEDVEAVDISPDGSKVLLAGERITGQFEANHRRAVVLELVPIESN